ncbi:MAG: mechanosensitive ion channel family protein, partial [Gordonibacter sp.]
MSTKLKVKIAILIAVAAISMVVMGALLSTMQNDLSLADYTQEMQQEAAALPELLASANDNSEQNKVTYDEIFKSKAESVAFMANNNAGFEATHAKMVEYKDLLGVDNVMVVGREGNLIASAQDTRADFTSSRFNQLRTVFSDGKPSEAVDVYLPEEDWAFRYYAARIDDATMVVVEQNPDELFQLIDETGSTESVLKNISIGQHGYVFAVSAQDYVIEYHPNSNLMGSDAIDGGLDAADLEDGTVAWM